MDIKIVKTPIHIGELKQIAAQQFGDVVKLVVDVKQGIIAVGPEMHADAEVLLMDLEHSKREDTWGINVYPEKSGEEYIEFDSMINLKPSSGNRSRGVEDETVREKIKSIIATLITS